MNTTRCSASRSKYERNRPDRYRPPGIYQDIRTHVRRRDLAPEIDIERLFTPTARLFTPLLYKKSMAEHGLSHGVQRPRRVAARCRRQRVRRLGQLERDGGADAGARRRKNSTAKQRSAAILAHLRTRRPHGDPDMRSAGLGAFDGWHAHKRRAEAARARRSRGCPPIVMRSQPLLLAETAVVLAETEDPAIFESEQHIMPGLRVGTGVSLVRA